LFTTELRVRVVDWRAGDSRGKSTNHTIASHEPFEQGAPAAAALRRLSEHRLRRVHDAFIRIRRSALVSVQAIQTVEPYGKGMYVLTLRDGRKLVSSRYHQAGLRRLLTSNP